MVSKYKFRVVDFVNKALDDNSDSVKNTKGFYIYQPNGIAHFIAGKLIKIEAKYFGYFEKYISQSRGEITLRAKEVFESKNM